MGEVNGIAEGDLPASAGPNNDGPLELTENDLIELLVAAANAGGLQEGEMWRDDLYKLLNKQKPMTTSQFRGLMEKQAEAGTISQRKIGHRVAYRMVNP